MSQALQIAAEISRRWDELNRDGKLNRDEVLMNIITEMLGDTITSHDKVTWQSAALSTRLCRADVDVSTPEKYQAAQADAATKMLAEIERLKDIIASSNFLDE